MTDSTPSGNDAGHTSKKVPTTANTGAIAAVGLDLQEGKVIPRRQVFSWALWDWATQPFNSVIITFVFTALYLVTEVFIPADIAALADDDPLKVGAIAGLTAGLGLTGGVAGLAIAVLAPVLGQRVDGTGRRKFWLLIYTAILVILTAMLFFTQAEPSFFWYGAWIIAIGSVFSELAGVNYNSLLVTVSTPRTIGKISGLGWGLGYIGGILALVIVVVAQFAGWFGMSQADLDAGLNYRLVALGCALWTVIFCIPMILWVPESERVEGKPKVSFFASYIVLVRDIRKLFRESRPTFWFLVASAVYRDGLAGVFAFGAVIAAVVFGFGFIDVVLFGIAANLIAGISTIIAGRFDDIFGARAVIVTALVGLVVSGLAVFLLAGQGDMVFWVGGLLLCAFVGPAQASSRSMLARVTPAGKEGEIFGLYATTGRAASFISPLLWAGFITLFGSTVWGVLGIVVVIAVGLWLLLLVKLPKHVRAQ